MKTGKKGRGQDPLPPKIAVTSGSNVIHSQTPGKLFPSCKLKANHTFTTLALIIGSVEGEANPGAKQEEGELEPLGDKRLKHWAEWKKQISL